MVLESDVLSEISQQGGRRGQLPQRAIPATLQDSLTARLDRLGPLKEVAQIAAAIGRSFPYELLAAASPLSASALDAALSRLVESGQIFRSGLQLRATYTFKHALVQDAAYNSMLLKKRQELHGRIAHALEAELPHLVTNHPEILAHHYTEANLPVNAVDWWKKAGEQAAARSEYAEAIAHLNSGLALFRGSQDALLSPTRELELTSTLAPVYLAAKGWVAPETRRSWLRCRELCEELESSLHAFPTLYGLCAYFAMSSELQDALESSVGFVRRARLANDVGARIMAHRV